MIQEQNPATPKIPWPIVTTDSLENNQAPGATIKVRCIAPQGLYYDFQRRREGDVFTLRPQYVTVMEIRAGRSVPKKDEDGRVLKKLVSAESQFSEATMERVSPKEPEKTTTAQQALNKAQDSLNEAKLGGKGR